MKALIALFVLAATATFGQLRVDSVTVDSVWNTGNTIRPSRDCRVSFYPRGITGLVQAVVYASSNGGATFWPPYDSVFIVNNTFNPMLQCGQKQTVTVRVLGQDRDNFVIRVKIRQPRPDTVRVLGTLSRPLVMASIPGGKFAMGQVGWAEPVHGVIVSDFSIMATEVTQEIFSAVMGYNPSSFRNAAYPVERLSWFDAVLFCNALGKRAGLDTCYTYSAASISGTGDARSCGDLADLAGDFTRHGYRLPTEAEWEYACRAGTATIYYWGDDKAGVGTRAWWASNSGSRTHTVAGLAANAFGLYDMAGNVTEWCGDWFAAYALSGAVEVNPLGPPVPDAGTMKSSRGGAWNQTNIYDQCDPFSSGCRSTMFPGYIGNNYGFRVVRR